MFQNLEHLLPDVAIWWKDINDDGTYRLSIPKEGDTILVPAQAFYAKAFDPNSILVLNMETEKGMLIVITNENISTKLIEEGLRAWKIATVEGEF